MVYNIFVIDPPWPQRKGGQRAARPNQGRSLDYETLTVAEIFALLDEKVLSQAHTQHCVFLWEIDKYLIPAEQEMERRGYRRHARIIWDKCNGVAPAFTVRYTHEYLVWWYKPRLPTIEKGQRGKFPTVIREPAREHSRKPESAYMMIDSLYPDLPKIDVFSRERRDGWQQWGNQVDYFDREAALLFAEIIEDDDPQLGFDLRQWIESIA